MGAEKDDDEGEESEQDTDKPRDSGDDKKNETRLGWKDYAALFIAFVETIALPLVILIVILFAVLAYIGFFR